ncbi:MAG: ATP-binding protein [Drouetiella hepatica Uher 2000/2452]|jgi:SpoVK/Ycf46/Vps4 family AAA+-type ATPase|uniref:ATP-binding protein n=1 Tax=Drouetiella hepatica Uher 2000/2452 TaxID=904376 RepID=A0A951QA03_9CYAN|nr:ATP-binding protein [Drouetiella hepatica Uher 2000/2452]
MPLDSADSFIDNWAYLKAELQRIDRILMLAIARQKKETKDVDRIAQSKADRATSHWWKGVVSLEGNAAYDEYRQPSQAAAKPSQQQQLEQRIRASRQKGVVLALPALSDRLQLTSFEKNLVLMSLAPELNRRYAKLYRFLRTEETAVKTDLPSLDLVLRLFCRNDVEWRSARNRLLEDSPLNRYQLLQLLPTPEETLLNSSLKLEETLLNYLVSEQPTLEALEGLLNQRRSIPTAPSSYLKQTVAVVEWQDLILPTPLLNTLQYSVQRLQGYTQVEKLWHFQPQSTGIVLLLSGSAGTGKTIAAQAIAHSLQTPLFQVNLAQVPSENYPQLLQDISTQAPIVLLLDAAQLWLGRSSKLDSAALHQFFNQRHHQPALTLLSVPLSCVIPADWRSHIDQTLSFPLPSERDRLQLWKRAFPPQVPIATDIDWQTLAQQLSLTGGEIGAIAQDTILYAAAIESPKVSMEHLLSVLAQRGIALKRKELKAKSSASD